MLHKGWGNPAQTEMSLLKQYVGGERVDLLEALYLFQDGFNDMERLSE